MVDIENPNGTPTLNDFRFHMGNDNNPDGWKKAPLPSIRVRPREGVNGSTRVELVWADHDIEGQWLQVTVLANENTALLFNDVFYFGNAPGETGNSSRNALVDAFDTGGVRDNAKSFLNPARIDDRYDFDRDKDVDAFDFGLVRDNATSFLTDLNLISPPSGRSRLVAESLDRSVGESAAGTPIADQPAAVSVSGLFAAYQQRSQPTPNNALRSPSSNIATHPRRPIDRLTRRLTRIRFGEWQLTHLTTSETDALITDEYNQDIQNKGLEEYASLNIHLK